MSDLIDRQAAIRALWEALYDYEDKTEKQFQESKELDVGDWIQHRIFVQNMNDIDRKTILELPSAQPKTGRWINYGQYADFFPHNEYRCSVCDQPYLEIEMWYNYCPNCGAKMEGGKDEC